jgi:hypothetical protein
LPDALLGNGPILLFVRKKAFGYLVNKKLRDRNSFIVFVEQNSKQKIRLFL